MECGGTLEERMACPCTSLCSFQERQMHGARIQCGCRHGTDDTLSQKGRVFKDRCSPHSSRDGRGWEVNNYEDLQK